MKTAYKILISFLIGVCLIVIGVAIGGVEQMNISQFSFLKDFQLVWSADRKDDIQLKAASSIEDIEMNTSMADIEFYEEDHLDYVIVNASHIYSGFEVKQDKKKLIINQPHYWTTNDSQKRAKIKITVPKGMQFEEMNIKANAGMTIIKNVNAKDVCVENAAGKLTMNNIVCQNMEIDASMSQTDLSQVTCQNHLDIDLGMGDINILFNTHKQAYTYSVDVGMGSVQIGDEKFSGFVEKDSHHGSSHDHHIDVDCGMGSVKIEMEE